MGQDQKLLQDMAVFILNVFGSVVRRLKTVLETAPRDSRWKGGIRQVRGSGVLCHGIFHQAEGCPAAGEKCDVNILIEEVKCS